MTAELFCLIVGGALTLVGAALGSHTLLEPAFLMLGLAGVLRLAKIVLWPERYWALCNLVAGAGLAVYFLGAFVTLVQYNVRSVDLYLLTGEDFPNKAFVATLYLALFYGVLVGLAAIENRFWQPALTTLGSLGHSLDRETALSRQAMVAFMIAISGAQVLYLLTGVVSLQGSTGSGVVALTVEQYRVSVGVALVQELAACTAAVSGWVLGLWEKPRKIAALAVIVAICDVVWLAVIGRRMLMFGCFTFFTFFVWARGNVKLFRTAALAAIAAVIVFFGFKLFVAMRYASYAYAGAERSATFQNLLSDALSLIIKQPKLVGSLEQQNYESRFFDLQYLITVVTQLSFDSVRWGQTLLIALFSNIPSVFFPAKTAILQNLEWGADGKTLVAAALGLFVVDEPWTPFVAAYADFMWLGVVIYPLIFLGLGWLFSRVVQAIRYPWLVAAALGLCMIHFVGTEETMTGYFATIRVLILLWVTAKAIAYLDKGRSTHSIPAHSP